MSLADFSTHLDPQVPAASDVTEASDLALLSGMSDGDPACSAELRSRHAVAVSLLVDAVGAEAVHAAWERFEDDVRSGRPVGAPVRVHWLAGSLAADEVIGCHDRDDAIWRAFVNLAPAWQTALWHAEVEYDDAATVGRLLGLDASDSRRAVASAVVGVRRAVTTGHDGGSTPECHWLVEDLRANNSTTLGTAQVRVLREHGRHCDDCLPLVREVFRVEHSLRDILAAHVLGRHAAEYLRTRPRSRAIGLVPLGASAPVALVRRAGRPTIGVLASGLTAAAVLSAFMISTPQVGSSSEPTIAAPALPPSGFVDRVPSVSTDRSTTGTGRPSERLTLVSTSTSDTGKGRRGESTAAEDDTGDTTVATSTPSSPSAPSAPSTGGQTPPAEPTSPGGETPAPGSGGGTGQTPDPAPEPTTPVPDPGTAGNSNTAREPVVSADVDVDQNGSVEVTVDVPVLGTPPIVVDTPPLLGGLGSGLLP